MYNIMINIISISITMMMMEEEEEDFFGSFTTLAVILVSVLFPLERLWERLDINSSFSVSLYPQSSTLWALCSRKL